MAGRGSPDPAGAAERCLATLGSLPKVLAASPRRLLAITGGDRAAVDACRAFHDAMSHTLGMRLAEQPLLSNYTVLYDYLRARMSHLTAEQTRVLYLTGHHRLISDELLSMGSLGEAPHYPREIIHRALDCGAASMIMVHNHPSGDPTPSNSDRRITRIFAHTAETIDLHLLDHIIVGRDRCTSMRQEGLL